MTYNQDDELICIIMPKPRPQQEVISIEADAAVPDTYGLERLMEEVNILELEGYYFSPNRKSGSNVLAKKVPASPEVREQEVNLILSVKYGQPGELAYKVLQALFYKLTQQGPTTQGRILISRHELAELVGRSKGGKQSAELYTALKQLVHTGVVCNIRVKNEDGTKDEKEIEFHILKTAAYEKTKRGQFARCMIDLHDVILKNLQRRLISYFNWERMRGLDMVGMMLYKRFFRHMANIYREGMDKNRLVFEKDYEQICTTWLGLKPVTKRALIERQLGKRLEALKACRLLREYRIEERARGGGFKIVAYAGSGFFADYDNIYRRRLPASVPALCEPEPLVYLHEFHQQLGHDQEEFSPKEIAFARSLLARYGDHGVKSLMAFAFSRARETGFHAKMQWFGSLALYEGNWQAKERKLAKARQLQATITACPVCNEGGMLEFEDGTVGRCPHELAQITLIQSHKPIRGFHRA